MSEILAVEKGRARDYELNSICRQALSLCIACRLTWRRRHIVSEKNLADFDSRLASLSLLRPCEAIGGGEIRKRLAIRRLLCPHSFSQKSPWSYPMSGRSPGVLVHTTAGPASHSTVVNG